jgi:hypothetical protein
MNTTNRGLNRLFILLVGLVLLAAGLASIALGVLPTVSGRWKHTASTLADGAQPWVADPVIGTASWLVVGIALACLLLIVVLIVFITNQGHGRTAAALQQHDGATRTRIDLAVPKTLLQDHLQHRPELAGLRISAYEVRGTPMLKITARCRRGVSPALVADLIGRAVNDLEHIVGTDIAIFVQLTGGFRAGAATRAQVA